MEAGFELDQDVLVPVKILNVVRFPIGGIRAYLRYTYSLLDPDVYSTTILAVRDPEAWLLAAGMGSARVNLEIVPERHALLRLSLATRRLLGTGRFDIVHSQGMTAAVASAFSARWYGVTHVVTLHETFRAEQFAGILGATKRQLLARVLGSADTIVAVSADARENLLRHMPLSASAADRLVVIRNGVAVDTLDREAVETRPRLRARWGIDENVALLAYVGRFMPEKGFDVLLEAVRTLKHVSDLPRFVVVAVNDGAFLREYRQQISEWDLESSFIFTGLQPSAAGTLTEVDAVVMPSRREACPLVAMEAMVLGCPLIASDCIGLRELTIGTPTVQCVTGDTASLAAAIEHFLRRRQTIRARALAHVAAARHAFDSSRTAEALVAVFTKAMVARRHFSIGAA